MLFSVKFGYKINFVDWKLNARKVLTYKIFNCKHNKLSISGDL